ncbi:MAG: hypothetical protein ABII64_02530 [Elusimicrobiota bacterium]
MHGKEDVLRKEYGFILLETLIALVIIGTVLVFSIYSIGMMLKVSGNSDKYCMAAMVCQSVLVEARSGNSERSASEGSLENAGVKFKWKREYAPFNKHTDLCTITVIWDENGRESQAVIQTLSAKPSADLNKDTDEK